MWIEAVHHIADLWKSSSGAPVSDVVCSFGSTLEQGKAGTQ